MEALKTRDTSVFVQSTPGKAAVFLGDCVDLDSIPNPRGAITTLYCWNRNRDGFVSVGKTIDTPGNLEFSLTELVFESASYIEELNCPFTVFAMQRVSGPAGLFNNWVRGSIVDKCELSDDTFNNVANHETDEAITHDYDMTGDIPRIDVRPVGVGQVTTIETEDLLSISICKVLSCAETIEPCEQFVISCAAGTAASGNVLFSNDSGAAVAAAAADPFAVAEDVNAIACFPWFAGGVATNRWLAVRATDGANPMEIAYSDDGGATWTLVVVGATNGEFTAGPNSLFVLDGSHIWISTDQGNVFFSADGGVTWTDQNTLTPSGGNGLNCIHFADEDNGYAVGDADTVIYTADGGATWAAATATGLGVNLLSVVTFSRYRAIIGAAVIAAGSLVMTFDGGATYEQKAFTGNAAETVEAISFQNNLVGSIVTNTAAPVGSLHMSIDGGATWFEITVPSNDGFSDVDMCSPNELYVSGLASAGTGMILHGTG